MVRPYPYSIMDHGGHYVIDNFEFPCNSVKNVIPIWNFTNTFIQECKMIWEFQIRWGGTPQTFMEIMEIFKGTLIEIE